MGYTRKKFSKKAKKVLQFFPFWFTLHPWGVGAGGGAGGRVFWLPCSVSFWASARWAVLCVFLLSLRLSCAAAALARRGAGWWRWVGCGPPGRAAWALARSWGGVGCAVCFVEPLSGPLRRPWCALNFNRPHLPVSGFAVGGCLRPGLASPYDAKAPKVP